MRIAILGGNVEDERHLGRLCEKAGAAPAFVRSALGALLDEAPASSELGVLDRAIERLGGAPAGAFVDEVNPSGANPRPRAIVIDAAERSDVALRILANVRRDPYFERVPALLMLPAAHAEALALPGGFDDFVLSPCSVDEVAIRIRALARRRTESARGNEESAGVTVDEQSRTVVVDGHGIQLTAREFALFTYLCEWRGRVLSREHLLARVWGSRYSGGRRTVDIHVRRLRAKLGASLAIETLRGSGYRLRREPAPEPVQMPEPFSKVS